jgi:hypothetical protein
MQEVEGFQYLNDISICLFFQILVFLAFAVLALKKNGLQVKPSVLICLSKEVFMSYEDIYSSNFNGLHSVQFTSQFLLYHVDEVVLE